MAPHKWNVGSPTKGARVRIHGLRSAPHFNNITATVLKHTPSGRVAVRFLVPDSKHQTLAARLSAPVSKKHQTLAVRPANLKPAPSTPCSGLLALKQCEDNAGDVVIPAGCGCSLRFRTSDRPTREGVDWIATLCCGCKVSASAASTAIRPCASHNRKFWPSLKAKRHLERLRDTLWPRWAGHGVSVSQRTHAQCQPSHSAYARPPSPPLSCYPHSSLSSLPPPSSAPRVSSPVSMDSAYAFSNPDSSLPAVQAQSNMPEGITLPPSSSTSSFSCSPHLSRLLSSRRPPSAPSAPPVSSDPARVFSYPDSSRTAAQAQSAPPEGPGIGPPLSSPSSSSSTSNPSTSSLYSTSPSAPPVSSDPAHAFSYPDSSRIAAQAQSAPPEGPGIVPPLSSPSSSPLVSSSSSTSPSAPPMPSDPARVFSYPDSSRTATQAQSAPSEGPGIVPPLSSPSSLPFVSISPLPTTHPPLLPWPYPLPPSRTSPSPFLLPWPYPLPIARAA